MINPHQAALSDKLTEAALRSKLGIPAEARQILILAESSHWDPNWLYTSEEYYTRWVEHNLLMAVAELVQSPRRIYSVECMFFLRMFWDRHPELHETIQRLVNENRLRMTSSGVTSADTLTPDSEAILRDLVIGQEWLRTNDMHAEPRLAYFPDCFGHTPALPALLNAAGFTMTAFSRLDGMYMVGCDYEPQSAFPRAGSNAETLLKREKSLDFIWRGANNSQVLTHWNAFTYGQGDMIAYHGVARVYLLPRFLYFSDRSDGLVAKRIRQYVAQLAPLSRTPYLFCPIGIDFVAPVPDLVSLLDRYNERHYPDTGTWVLNAGLDDYLELVDFHRERLPVIELDPNPYWTGFYTSRPSLKKRCHILLNRLLAAEGAEVQRLMKPDEAKLPGARAASPTGEDLLPAWWAVATSNHHDFITGTSPDRVAAEDQIPMLDQAIAKVDVVLTQARQEVIAETNRPPAETKNILPAWERQGHKIVVTSADYVLELDETAGGCITRLWHPATGREYLESNSLEIVDAAESGGLWRMGMEFKGGKYQTTQHSSVQTVTLNVQPATEGLLISSTMRLGERDLRCTLLCRSDSPLIRFRVEGRAVDGHTVTARFKPRMQVEQMVMENPGGIVARPVQKIFTPTFWPVQHFCYLQDKNSSQGMAILLALPGAVSCNTSEHSIEVVTHRNATQEKVYGFIPLLACPAKGHEPEDTIFQFALYFPGSGDWASNRIPQLARDYARGPWTVDLDPALYQQIAQEVVLDSKDVWVEAIKPAWRGEGIILRLWSYKLPAQPVTLELRDCPIKQAWVCDVRERDIRPVTVQDGRARLELEQTITSIRLLF